MVYLDGITRRKEKMKRDTSMQLRTLALILSTVGLLYSGVTSALGLGEITLKSQFNQPLNAEIRLLKVRDLSEEEILTALASREDFSRAGVDRIFFLSGLNFEVVLDNPSNPFIRVTTRKPVTEPYLNFLIEVQWPSGRLLREYTLLLDLPVFTEAAPSRPAVTAPSSGGVVSSPSQQQQPPPRVERQPRETVSAPAPVYSSSQPTTSNPPVDSYRVQSGDTLWEIAERTRPDSSISVHQAMIAIQQANPNAFIDNNINRLRNGRVLRIPSSGEITDITYNQAVNAVRQQNQKWSSSTSQKPVLTSAAPTASTPSSASTPEGRLTLGSADSGQGDVKSAGASGSGESLQNELAIAQEELDRSSRENSELRDRISELESQIQTMEELVSVTNDQLKALQIATQTNNEADASVSVTEADSSTSIADTSVDGIDSSIATDPVENINEITADTQDDIAKAAQEVLDNATDTVSDAAVTDTDDSIATAAEDIAAQVEVPPEEPVVATPAPVEPPAPVTPVEQTGSSFDIVEFVKSNLLAVGGGLLALLVAILVLLRLREKPEEPDFGEFDLDSEEDLLVSDEDVEEEISLDGDDYDVEDDELDDSVQAQTEDVVAEADIYVSLGQEDKAIELLQKEIQQNPDNADARLGLLKIYAKSQDSEGFDEQYAQLLPLGNVYANDQAMALRKEISNVEPFDTDQYSLESGDDDSLDTLAFTNDADDDIDLDLDLDLDLGDDDDSLSDSTIDFTGSDDIGDLSIDLDDLSEDLEDINNDKSGSTEDSLSLSGLDDELDLDLNIDEDVDLDLDAEVSEADLTVSDELANDLSSLSVEEPEAIGNDGIAELDLDIDDDFASSLDDLDNDLSLSLDDDASKDNDLEFDLDFDSAEDKPVSNDLDLDVSDVDSPDAGLSVSSEEELDLDVPPSEDLDIASLDQEIDAMTAELDDALSLDEESLNEEPLDEGTLDDVSLDETVDIEEAEEVVEPEEFSVDLDEEESIDLSETNFDHESLAEDDDSDDLDFLANSEMAQEDADTSVEVDEDLGSADDINIASAMDDAAIAEDDELNFLEESDEVSTKLDLARAYLDMGDREGAEDILGEVLEEGNPQQKTEAKELMAQI